MREEIKTALKISEQGEQAPQCDLPHNKEKCALTERGSGCVWDKHGRDIWPIVVLGCLEGKLQISPKSKLSRAAKEKAKQPAQEGKIDVITPGKSPGSGHR